MAVTAQETLARTILLTRQERLPDVDGGALLEAFRETTVAIVADEANACTPAAQAAITTLVGLTSACGMRARLVLPRIAVAGYQPPVVGPDLIAGLCDLAADSAVGAEATLAPATRPNDIVFVLGSTRWDGNGERAWRLSADGWSGSLVQVRSDAPPITDRLPIGALAAACAAAAEPYRIALERVVRRTGCRITVAELLQPVEVANVRLAPRATPKSEFPIGTLDVVSGGALATSLIHALLRVEDFRAALRVWEPQDAEVSNLNRYALLRRSMLPITKVEMLRRWEREGVSIEGYSDAVDEGLAREIRWAPWVFVGADMVEARWYVQNAWPDHLAVAGTVGFAAVASEHDPQRPCAGCLHPAANPPGGEIATISFVSYLGGLMAAARLLRWSVDGPSIDAEQMTEAYADRLDSRTGFRHGSVARNPVCPVRCAA